MITAVILVFFYPIWLENKVALPADITVGAYYPWLDYKYEGFPAGVPIKNPITTDVISFMYPMQTYAIKILKSGQWPLWNNLILGGIPLLANFQSAPFSLVNIFYLFLPNLDAWNLQIILQLILAAVFTYLLLREFERTKLASVAGGIFYGFSGFLMIWLEWNGHSLTAAFFPLIILLTLKILKTFQVKWGVLLAITLALQIFSGYPQIILYQFMALLLLVIIFDRKILFNVKKLFILGIFFFLGISLAAIQIIPAAELLSFSQRGVEDVLNTSAFLPWQQIITFIAPDYFGNHATGNYWGSGDYTLNTGFSGVVVFILASLGFLTFKKEKAAKFSLGLIILALVICLPNPLSIFLKESGLLGLQAASAHRALFLMNLGFALLAAFGIDSINKVSLKSVIRSMYLPGILLGGYVLATLLMMFLIKQDPVFGIEIYRNLMIGLRNLFVPSLTLVATGTLLMLNLRLKRNQIISVLVIAIAVFELFRFGWKFTPFAERQLVFPSTPVLEFLQKQEKPFRVVAEDAIPINMMMAYNLETLEGYDAVYPINIAKYISALNSGSAENLPMGRYGSVDNLDSNLLDIANSKYILALKRGNDNSPDENGQVPEEFKSFDEVFSDKTVVVLENKNVIPRARIFHNFEIIEDSTKQLETLIDQNFPVNDKLILDEDPGISIATGSETVSTVEEFNKKVLQVNSSSNGLLFIGDSFYPGWKAYVDNKETKILRANYNFMAIPVEAGEHMVEVQYLPDSFEKGKMISLISAIILLGVISSSWLKKRFKWFSLGRMF